MGAGSLMKQSECDTSGRQASTLNRLEQRRKQLQEELDAVNEAMKLFEAHPEIPDALDLIGRIRI